jgi:type II secretory pathway component PulF
MFDAVERAVTSGGHPSAALEASGLIEPFMCQAIHTGEESGNLGGAMAYCADILDETNEELIKAAMRLLEPLILIVMGFVVGAVAISLFLPLFDMTAAIQ